jgi:hypothetical protein
MRKLSYSFVLLSTLIIGASSGQTPVVSSGQTPPAAESYQVIHARKAALIKIYGIQELVMSSLKGEVSDSEFDSKLAVLFDPKTRPAQLSDATWKSFTDALAGWRQHRSRQTLTKALTAIELVKSTYNPIFRGEFKLAYFAKDLELVEARSGGDEALVGAHGHAAWLKNNVGDARMRSADKRHLSRLYQAYGDYTVTGDRALLTEVAGDLTITQQYYDAMGAPNLPLQSNQFTFQTIDKDGKPVPGWTIYAMALSENPVQVGNPSDPNVTGELMPGRWVFFGEKAGVMSRGVDREVRQGRLVPNTVPVVER